MVPKNYYQSRCCCSLGQGYEFFLHRDVQVNIGLRFYCLGDCVLICFDCLIQIWLRHFINTHVVYHCYIGCLGSVCSRKMVFNFKTQDCYLGWLTFRCCFIHHKDYYVHYAVCCCPCFLIPFDLKLLPCLNY